MSFCTVIGMKLDVEQCRTLGVTWTEAKVLSVCNHEGKRVSDLARLSGVPRSTVRHILKRLQKRGWLECEMYRTRPVWRLASSQKIQALIGDMSGSEAIQQSGPQMVITNEFFRMKLYDSTEYVVHQGLEQLITILERVSYVPRHTRVYAIESHKANRELMQKVPHEAVIDINTRIQKNKSIWEGIISREYYQSALQVADRAWLESLEGRSQITHVMPDEMFKKVEQMLLFDERVFFLNWDTEVALEISDPSVVEIQKSMFQNLQLLGKKKHNDEIIREAKKYCRE